MDSDNCNGMPVGVPKLSFEIEKKIYLPVIEVILYYIIIPFHENIFKIHIFKKNLFISIYLKNVRLFVKYNCLNSISYRF